MSKSEVKIFKNKYKVKTFKGKNSKQFNYIAKKYNFRFNVVTSFYEWKLRDDNVWVKYDDRTRNSLLLELMSEDKELKSVDFNIFIESNDMSEDYNPFEEYFDELPKWNEKIDYIKQIAETVKTSNQDHFEETLKRYLVGCIDCLLNVDAVNDVCLVFQAGQGLGKTRWMRALLPKQFQQEYLYEGNIDTKNKDHTMYLSQYWFIHLDELETLRSNEISAIKSYITRQRISVRKAYGRYKTNFVRRASFLGSVNEDKFLSDITGNRRWLVFRVSSIHYQHTINTDNVWAQAYHLWKDESFRHWFDIEEIKKINLYNEEFRMVSFEEEQLVKNFNFPDAEANGEWMVASEVVIKLGSNMPSIMAKLHNPLMGKALSKLCKLKKVSGGYTKYYLDYIGIESKAPTDFGAIKQQTSQSLAINEDDDLPF